MKTEYVCLPGVCSVQAEDPQGALGRELLRAEQLLGCA